VRDRALLLLGFAGAFRRSELVSLDVADLQFCDGGLRVTIHRSKTDQEGQGATIAIVPGSTACPVKAVRSWIEAAGLSDGPLFRPVIRFDDAFHYAHHLHRTQMRKGTPIPYISHLMTVAALVIEHGGNEDQAIAALLHTP
jgi:integrase